MTVGSLLEGARGRYRLLGEVGRGGFGVTFRAQPVDGTGAPSGGEVIVKTLALRGLPGWKAVELFERETAALRALSHPLIPGWVDDLVLGSAEAPEGFALVMQLQPGRTLREVMRAGGLSRRQLLQVMADVLEVLAFIHGRAPPLVHRDVNPKNIILRPDGRAALVDFGSVQAALRAAPGADGHTAAGTFGYAPMEQFLGQATPRSDLYGLGMTVLAAASGSEPEQLPLDGIVVNVPAVIGDGPLARLLQRLVAPDPRARMESAEEALRLLRPLLGGDGDGDGDGDGKPRATPAATTLAKTTAGSATADHALERLARRLGAEGFDVERGGTLGQMALSFRAHRAARGLTGRPVEIVATTARAIGGGTPLQPIPATLFAQAVADGRTQADGGWRQVLGVKPLVLALVACPEGIAARTRAHLLHWLKEPEAAVVIPVFLGPGTGALGDMDVLRPRSLVVEDARGFLDEAWRVVKGEDEGAGSE